MCVCKGKREGWKGEVKTEKQTGEMKTKSKCGLQNHRCPLFYSQNVCINVKLYLKVVERKILRYTQNSVTFSYLLSKFLLSKCCFKGIFKALMHFTKMSQVPGNKTALLNTKPLGPEPSISLSELIRSEDSVWAETQLWAPRSWLWRLCRRQRHERLLWAPQIAAHSFIIN